MSQELVLIGGFPASGKTTIAKEFTDKGYVRLNRDIAGGQVDDLLPKLKEELKKGNSVVMDNLYATKISRASAIDAAKSLGVKVKFVQTGATLEDSQFNACSRMMEKCGKVLSPEDHKSSLYKDDPNLFPVVVLYKYRKDYEEPNLNEGFESIDKRKFIRKIPSDWVNKAVIFDFDGTLRESTGPEDYPTEVNHVKAFVNRKDKILEYQKNGYILLGASNQSGIAKGKLTHDTAKACFDETLKQIGVVFEETLYCCHKIPPLTCYCRKPGPGMMVEFFHKYKLDPKQCIFVGDMTSDKTCAARAGVKYISHEIFFKD